MWIRSIWHLLFWVTSLLFVLSLGHFVFWVFSSYFWKYIRVEANTWCVLGHLKSQCKNYIQDWKRCLSKFEVTLGKVPGHSAKSNYKKAKNMWPKTPNDPENRYFFFILWYYFLNPIWSNWKHWMIKWPDNFFTALYIIF